MGYKQQIASLLSGQPRREAVEHVINESHQLALAYLRKKARCGRLSAEFFDLSIDDLALDCIADLFERNEEGQFEQLQTYYQSMSWHELDDAELHFALRRLIFSQVNDGLFRRYRQADPNLSKIIRNVKIAARSNPACALVSRNGETWLVAHGEGTLTSQPLAPPELLEIYLTASIEGLVEMPTVVAGFIECAQTWDRYANGYPVVRLARAIRSALIRLNAVDYDGGEDRSAFLDGEVERAIARAARRVKDEMHASYVGSGKVDSRLFEQYLQAIQDVMASEYADNDTDAQSYFEALQVYRPGLSKTTYRREHRNRFEYMAKKCRAELLDYLKDEPW